MAEPGRKPENSTEVGTQELGPMRSKRSRNSLFNLKMAVRRQLVIWLPAGGRVYMAYAGACRLAEAYPGRDVYGAEIKAEMFSEGVPDNVVSWVHADCDLEFPFDGGTEPWAVGDFDHYHLPYPALRRFLEGARLAERVALFFTDTAQRRLFYHPRILKFPDGSDAVGLSPDHLRQAWERYVPDFMLPNLVGSLMPGYKVVKWAERRRRNTIMWGVVLDVKMGL